MSFIKNLFGKKEESATSGREKPSLQPLPTQTNKVINLEKVEKVLERVDLVKINLEKKKISNTMARVGLAMDISGSMSPLFNSGKVQEMLERLLPISLELDDNGEMEIWAFNDLFERKDSVTLDNFQHFIQDEFKSIYGGTSYAPVMRDIMKNYVKEDPSDTPTLILFITDGDNREGDKKLAREVTIESSKHNIFWQFVGIGNSHFEFLKELDNLKGRVIDNANFFSINDLNDLTDGQLYDKLLNEFPIWLKEAKNLGIISQ